MKRAMDIALSLAALIVSAPALVLFALLVWLRDFHGPLYVGLRVGRNGRPFGMLKLRSMVAGADRSGVSSTSAQDGRITGIGRVIRACKADELMQFANVLAGDMSLVGPRPQVISAVDLYTQEEARLLSVRPGVTDIASIVFSDEGDILRDSLDPDSDYDRLIRPWKSRLGLLYVDNASLWLDLRLVLFTAVALVSRPLALRGVRSILVGLGADSRLVSVASRAEPLPPAPPPGSGGAAERHILL